MSCLCPQCAALPAPTYTEAHRLACEARRVLDIRGIDARRAYLDAVEKERGPAAGAELRAAVKAEWNRGRVPA